MEKHSRLQKYFSGPGVPRPRACKSLTKAGSVQVSDIQRILDAAGVDYRDCFEREQLLQRLRDNETRLAGHLANQLQSLQLQQQPLQPSGLTALTPSQLAAQNSLFMDEQYVVNLFQASSCMDRLGDSFQLL